MALPVAASFAQPERCGSGGEDRAAASGIRGQPLSSTVQFLGSEQDERAGSPELQREVIRQALSKLDRVRVDRVIETQPVQRVASGALLTCLLDRPDRQLQSGRGSNGDQSAGVSVFQCALAEAGGVAFRQSRPGSAQRFAGRAG